MIVNELNKPTQSKKVYLAFKCLPRKTTQTFGHGNGNAPQNLKDHCDIIQLKRLSNKRFYSNYSL